MTHEQQVGVVGAGTMGAGIALVALNAGHHVIISDVAQPVLDKAQSYVEAQLKRQVDKGRIEEDERTARLARIAYVNSMEALRDCHLVIEAVPERMDLKQKVFEGLEAVCREDAILASNTSSLSITVIGSRLKHPERLIGMHFFNPAPVMKLMELVVGEDTADDVVDRCRAFAKSFGKQAIVCGDSPGFIVNRVARNFYGEALRIVGEGSASVEQVDTLLREVGGFRMGPFELMDLIGIDVNFDVTQSVYHAYHEEPRFRPHLLQARKVEASRLGRKSGRGFYRYDEAGNKMPSHDSGSTDAMLPASSGSSAHGRPPVVIGNTPLAREISVQLAEAFRTSPENAGLCWAGLPAAWDTRAVAWRAEEVEAYLRRTQPGLVFVSIAADVEVHRTLLQAVERVTDDRVPIVTSLAGPSATTQAGWLRNPTRIRGFAAFVRPDAGTTSVHSVGDQRAGGDGADGTVQTVEYARPFQVHAGATDNHPEKATGVETPYDAIERTIAETFARLDWRGMYVRDHAGGITQRILSMILNEAQEVLHEGTTTPEDIDTGMRLGTNYPAGPIAWLDGIGVRPVLQTLQSLQRETGDVRYRPSGRLYFAGQMPQLDR